MVKVLQMPLCDGMCVCLRLPAQPFIYFSLAACHPIYPLKQKEDIVYIGSTMSVMKTGENTSTLETAMQLMIQTFHKYSGDEGDKYTLSRAELKEMLTTELGNYLGNAQDKEAVDKVMGDLDSNGDGEVDFTEFIILVGALTVACNDFFLEFNEKQEKTK
uniref:S100 calcium binding protein T n=1 Tax=Gadus morhua TaxID=8049 RepID=A0A8C4YXA9_GADMO